MGRTLTGQTERAVEDAASALHEWANEVIDSLYERDDEYSFHPERRLAELDALVARFRAAAARSRPFR